MYRNNSPKDFKVYDYWRSLTGERGKSWWDLRRENYLGTMSYQFTRRVRTAYGDLVGIPDLFYTDGEVTFPDEVFTPMQESQISRAMRGFPHDILEIVHQRCDLKTGLHVDYPHIPFTWGNWSTTLTFTVNIRLYTPYEDPVRTPYRSWRDGPRPEILEALSPVNQTAFKKYDRVMNYWYFDRPVPEPEGRVRRHNRDLCRRLTDEYNTFGEVDDSVDFWDGGKRTAWD